MKTLIVLAGGVCLLLLNGCAASTWQYVKLPDQSKTVQWPAQARIYVIRPADQGSAAANVWDGSQLIGVTGPDGFLCWERKPGETVITSISKDRDRLALPVRAGEVCYLVQEVGPGRQAATTSLRAVNEVEGQALLKQGKSPKLSLFVTEQRMTKSVDRGWDTQWNSVPVPANGLMHPRLGVTQP